MRKIITGVALLVMFLATGPALAYTARNGQTNDRNTQKLTAKSSSHEANQTARHQALVDFQQTMKQALETYRASLKQARDTWNTALKQAREDYLLRIKQAKQATGRDVQDKIKLARKMYSVTRHDVNSAYRKAIRSAAVLYRQTRIDALAAYKNALQAIGVK